MERAINIQTELMEISTTVANVPFVPTFTIYPQYFASLPIMILGKTIKTSYTTPAQYFDNLSTAILQKIKLENESDELPAIFNQISKADVYAVPNGHFDKKINVVVAPVVSIATKSKKKNQWWKYAAAACLVGLVTVTLIKLTQPSTVVNSEDAVIAGTNVTYKEIKALNVEAALDSLSSTDVDNYLCNNGLIACNDDKKVEEKLDTELEELNITDEDLEKFIDGTN